MAKKKAPAKKSAGKQASAKKKTTARKTAAPVKAPARKSPPPKKSAPAPTARGTRKGSTSAPATPPESKLRRLVTTSPTAARLEASNRDADVLDLFERESRRGAQAAAPTKSLGKYVYCIIESTSPLAFGRIGIGPESSDVETIHYKNIAAVVSETPVAVLDPTRENVLAHQRVNETVMREHTVLPMSFGTVFKTPDDIAELLRSAFDAFTDVLGKMQDKVEFGLKVLWDRDAIVRDIEREDEGIRRLKSEISAEQGSTYFARMQYGRMIEAALQARTERYVTEIFSSLRDVSVASRSNKPIGDRMIMNAAFLVSRDHEANFDAQVKAIGARHEALSFKYTGPWPPYNFVNIRLKLERAQ